MEKNWNSSFNNFTVQFIEDTLMEYCKHRKRLAFSMKRVAVSIFIPLAVFLAIYIVISDKILDEKVVNPYAIKVFDSFLLFIGVALGLNLLSYVQNKPTENNSFHQETIINSTDNLNQEVNEN